MRGHGTMPPCEIVSLRSSGVIVATVKPAISTSNDAWPSSRSSRTPPEQPTPGSPRGGKHINDAFETKHAERIVAPWRIARRNGPSRSAGEIGAGPVGRDADAPAAFIRTCRNDTVAGQQKGDLMSVLDGIGATPLVRLARVVPAGSARVLVKLEMANRSGSVKDRMARAVVEAAERDGRLVAGGTVVEDTAGTTGISLALVCAAKGYGLRIVFSDAFSIEKSQMMQALGAQISSIPSDGGRITASLIKAMIAASKEIGAQPGHWWVDQLSNADAITGYFGLGEEILSDTGGRVDAFVQAIGTAHAISGVAQVFRERGSKARLVGVEPAESAVLSGGPSAAHGIEGIGVGFLPPLWNPAIADELIEVPTAEAKAMARRLAREEGIFAGSSSGANVVAALQVAAALGPDATVVTLMCDSGLRYLSTDVFRPSPPASV